jgi:hypothetical protein
LLAEVLSLSDFFALFPEQPDNKQAKRITEENNFGCCIILFLIEKVFNCFCL